MSIIVKGEPMPEACAFCPCFRDDSIDGVHAYQCKATFITYGKEDDWIWNTRPNWCPLVELPEKHGRLIDGDALVTEMTNGIRAGNLEDGYEKYQNINNMDDCVECVKYADVVIEAEEEE